MILRKGGDSPEKRPAASADFALVSGLRQPQNYQKGPQIVQLTSKQRVVGSNPSRDAIAPASKRLQKFTKDLLDKFLSSRASGTSPKTFRIYHLALDRFIGYPLSHQGINAYLNSLTCGNAKHNYYRCIKTLCRWLYHTDQLQNNPIEKVLLFLLYF